MNPIESDFIESIWDDADFKTAKQPIKQSGETLKKNSIRRINDNNMIVTNCKVCKCEMSISTNYSGEFPLCTSHRDPNFRQSHKKNEKTMKKK